MRRWREVRRLTWKSLGSMSRSEYAELGTSGSSSVINFTWFSSRPRMSANLGQVSPR